MKRLTERDEFGNADIIGVDSMDLQCNLSYEEFNKVTNALNKLAEYEDLEEQGNMLIKAYEICLAQECKHCGLKKYVVDETWIRPELLGHDDFYKTKEEAEKVLAKMN